jgi:hypothetical protein
MPRRSKRNLIAEGEADYQKWRDRILADPTRRARCDDELAKQLAGLELRTYTKEQIQQFIADDNLIPEQQGIADEFARLPPRQITRGDSAAQRVLKLAGVWSDLDWDEAEKDLNRIRHESKPAPPLTLDPKDEASGK